MWVYSDYWRIGGTKWQGATWRVVLTEETHEVYAVHEVLSIQPRYPRGRSSRGACRPHAIRSGHRDRRGAPCRAVRRGGCARRSSASAATESFRSADPGVAE